MIATEEACEEYELEQVYKESKISLYLSLISTKAN